jgi:hypothetical protein
MISQGTPVEWTVFYRVKTFSVTRAGQYNMFNEFTGIKVIQNCTNQDKPSSVKV